MTYKDLTNFKVPLFSFHLIPEILLMLVLFDVSATAKQPFVSLLLKNIQLTAIAIIAKRKSIQ